MANQEFKGTGGDWYNPQFDTEIISMPLQIKIGRVYPVDQSSDQKAMRANAKLWAASLDLLKAVLLAMQEMKKNGITIDNADTWNALDKAVKKAL